MNLENPTPAPSVPSAGAFGKDISEKVFKEWLVWLFLFGLIIRVGFLVEHLHSPSFGIVTLDQKYYDTAARMLLAGEDLHQLRGLRPLLYPMFLAIEYKIGGAHGMDLAVVTQHLLGVLTGVLVALLGARLFRNRLCGLAAGALYLLAPVPLYFEGEMLVESSYTFLICLGLLLVIRTAGLPGWKGGRLWVLSGALTVFIAQERSNILLFILVYPLLACWHWWRTRQIAALAPLLGLVGGVVMAVPWGFVNKLQSDTFQPIPSAGGVNLYLGNKRTADGMVVELNRRVNYSEQYEDSVEVWARQEYQSAMRAQGRNADANPMAISSYWTRRAIAEIKAAPAAWMRLMAKKCWLMLWNSEAPNNKSFAFLQTEFPLLRLLPVRWVVLLMLTPAGIWAAAKWGDRNALFVLLLYAVLYSAANVAFFICDRYRYPVWPAMAVIGGGGAIAFVQSLRQRRWPVALGLAAGMGLMAAISLPNWFDAKLPNFARDYLFRSIAWYEKGHFPEALSDIDQSYALDPDDATTLHQRGNILFAMNRYDEARQDFERTLKMSGDDAGVWNNYAIALDRLGGTNDALQAYHRAIECDPPSKNAFLGMAMLLIRSGQLDAVVPVLDQFDKLERKPNAVALTIRSVLARRQGHATDADALEQQARALDAAATAWALEHTTNAAPSPR